LYKQLTERELRLKVQQRYLDLQQKKELKRLYRYLNDLYADYLKMAVVRVDVGAANRIEVLNLQAAQNEYQLLANQNRMEIANLEKQLASLLNTEEAITTADSLQPYPRTLGTGATALPILISKQNMLIEQANIEVLASELKPNFNLGYSLQKYTDGGWLNGLQAGISMPLFKKQNRQKVEAQQVQVAVAQANIEVQQLQTTQNLMDLENTIHIYAAGIEYYQQQLENINPEMERISKLNYQAGELAYLELLNTLNLLANNNQRYWEQVLAHNKALVQYQFLANKN
jgi:cobalt-zinc-cadmium resistance protein CzcA